LWSEEFDSELHSRPCWSFSFLAATGSRASVGSLTRIPALDFCAYRSGRGLDLMGPICPDERFRNLKWAMVVTRVPPLWQLRVLGFGLLQNGDVGIGVFPEGEEVFIGCPCSDGVA
jgi:hypothetical protein